jgi:hypothetical protein
MKISDFKYALPCAVVAGFYCLESLDMPLREKKDFHVLSRVEVTDESGKVLLERDTLLGLRARSDVFKPLRVYYMECVIRKHAVIHSQLIFEGKDHEDWLAETIEATIEADTTIDTIVIPAQWDQDPRRKVVLLRPSYQIIRVYEYGVIDLPKGNEAVGDAIKLALGKI